MNAIEYWLLFIALALFFGITIDIAFPQHKRKKRP